MGYNIQQLQTKVLISYSGNTRESAAVSPCYNVLAGNSDERMIYITTSGTNQGLNQVSVASFPFDDIDSCLTFDGVQLAPFVNRNDAIRILANYIFSCEASTIVEYLPPQDPSNTFVYGFEGGTHFQIKSEFTDETAEGAMFHFLTYPTDLVDNPAINEDLFFIRTGNDITLKKI